VNDQAENPLPLWAITRSDVAWPGGAATRAATGSLAGELGCGLRLDPRSALSSQIRRTRKPIRMLVPAVAVSRPHT
jgi:hypothetical protein